MDYSRIEINLGHVLVVEGLEADVLMGEPGKKDNDLDTKSSEEKTASSTTTLPSGRKKVICLKLKLIQTTK